MHYIDSGSRDPAHAVAVWLQAVLNPSVTEIRWQSGFFTAAPLGLFAPTLQQFATANRLVHALIGSNAPGTQRDAVLQLVQLLGLPRPNVRLGVVQYSHGLYHPKTIHLRRDDGSQCAYVGSANLTEQGVSLHVEAGLTLDTRDGDEVAVLNDVAGAVDAWFAQNREGLHLVAGAGDVTQLVTDGVLIVAPPPQPPAPPAVAGAGASEAAGGPGPARPPAPRLGGLASLPALPPLVPPAPAPTPAGPVAAPAMIPVVTQPPFPPHVLLAPGQGTPTFGAQALSGHLLPGGAVGVVVRLSGDTNRIFAAEAGTANMSLPTGTIETLRFGLQGGTGRYAARPRAVYDLMVRYIGAQTFAFDDPATTNVMPYGYLQAAEERGNRDIRMRIPAGIRALIPLIQGAEMPLPSDGDFALLEWPTAADPTVRLTFLQPGTPLATRAQQLFTAAANAHQLLGDNGCGLPAGVAPAW